MEANARSEREASNVYQRTVRQYIEACDIAIGEVHERGAGPIKLPQVKLQERNRAAMFRRQMQRSYTPEAARSVLIPDLYKSTPAQVQESRKRYKPRSQALSLEDLHIEPYMNALKAVECNSLIQRMQKKYGIEHTQIFRDKAFPPQIAATPVTVSRLSNGQPYRASSSQ